MIRKLSVTNLGCFDEDVYSIDFSKETLIAGPNNSGKSMFLTGINLIKYLVTGGFSWTTDAYNLFNFNEAIHAHETNREIRILMIMKDNLDEYNFETRITRNNFKLYLNGKPFRRGTTTQSFVDSLKKIWYFRPNRSPVRYSSSVRPSSGPLQPLNSDGSNIVNFLLERWTDRDKKWDIVETWLKKVDPDMSEMKTPISGDQTSLVTMNGNIPVNVSLQGSGFQSISTIISALLFSPDNSTVIIEEPEVFLHPSSQEIVVDLINQVVNEQNKQIIFSTHSFNILMPFYNNVGIDGKRRGKDHVNADPSKFSMWTFKKSNNKCSIDRYPLGKKTFQHLKADFKELWG